MVTRRPQNTFQKELGFLLLLLFMMKMLNFLLCIYNVISTSLCLASMFAPAFPWLPNRNVSGVPLGISSQGNVGGVVKRTLLSSVGWCWGGVFSLAGPASLYTAQQG